MKPVKAAIISISGTQLTDDEKHILTEENPLGVSLFARNINTPEQLSLLIKSIKESAGRNDILIAVDQEGGRVCRLKEPYFRHYASQAAIGSLPLEKAQQAAFLHAGLIADDLCRCGFNCNFSPTLDVVTPNITAALKSRCFSRDENVVAALGKVVFETYTGQGILSCIKHFPGHSGAAADPHLQLSVIKHINPRWLYPFEQIAPRALAGMTAHIVLEEVDTLPVTMSAKAISRIIRGQLGFKGLLISDALEMKALSGTLAEKTSTAIKAGCDAVCYCKGDTKGIREVLDKCGFLNDAAMQTYEHISTLIAAPHKNNNIENIEKKYKTLISSASEPVDDYDAVEVLNKL